MKIALIGSAVSSTHLAPHEDKSYQQYLQARPVPMDFSKWVNDTWEIWGCSPGAAPGLRRVTRFFELHRWEPGKPWLPAEYCLWLAKLNGPVYTGGPVPDLPNHVLYPIERVESEFGSYFLTSSLALMMALAILEIEDARKTPGHDPDDDVIGFWGVDMAAQEEYGYQRAGCQHFILEALRRGIGVYVPPESCLLRPMPVYGLSEWDHNYIKLTQRSREMNARYQDAAKRHTESQTEMAALAGSMEDLNYMVNTWTSPYGLPAGQVIRTKKGAGQQPAMFGVKAGDDLEPPEGWPPQS